MDIKLKPIWKYPYAKLSDLLVPLSIVEKQVRAVEGLDNFHFDIKIKNDTKRYTKDDLYVIPYPYVHGVRDEYSNATIITDEMKEKIHSRMLRYYNFALDKDILHQIDNDPNACSILNIYNGLVATFDRSEIREIVPLTVPYELPTMLSKLWNIHEGESSGDYKAMVSGIFIDDEEEDYDEFNMMDDYLKYIRRTTIQYHLTGEKYMIVYQLIRTKDSIHKIGDNDCIWASGTTENLHDAKDCMDINLNTISLYKQKSKVILVQ